MNRHNRRIELVGFPGTGKTHFCSKASIGNNGCVLLRGRMQRYVYAGFFFIKHPYIAMYFLLKTLKERQVKRSLKNKVFFLLFSAYAREAKAQPAQIIDEGLHQYLLSLYEVRVRGEDVRSDLKVLSSLDRFVYLFEIPESRRLEYMEQRGRSFAPLLSKKERETQTVTMKSTFQFICDFLPEEVVERHVSQNKLS